METRIGISGWRYGPWRGVFYPKDLNQSDELKFASRQVNSIEINGSFYSLQTPDRYLGWYGATPSNFMFSIKGPRYVSHILRLKDVQIPIANFFASGVLHLKEKLGPILWQLPPNFLFDEERIKQFFAWLPRTVNEAADLTKIADRGEKVEVQDVSGFEDKKIRYAMEVRHASFESPDFIDLLRHFQVALVFADTAGKWPYMEDITADFIYLRLHGDKEIYKSGYDQPTLCWWAERLRLWQRGKQPFDALTLSDQTIPASGGRDAFIYFDNDVKVRAPRDAMELSKLMNDKSTTLRERFRSRRREDKFLKFVRRRNSRDPLKPK